MSSEIKVTNIKHSSSGSNNLVLASDGNVSITNTLSAGTLGGSVTFPAGKVLNVSYSGRIPGSSLNSGGNSASAYTVYSFQPTLSSASNKVLVHLDAHVIKQTSTLTSHIAVSLKGGGITTADELLHGSYAYGWSQYQRFQLVASTLDSNAGSTTPTYYLHQGADTSGSVDAQWDDVSIVCIEIQG